MITWKHAALNATPPSTTGPRSVTIPDTELVEFTKQIRADVLVWLPKNHPQLVSNGRNNP